MIIPTKEFEKVLDSLERVLKCSKKSEGDHKSLPDFTHDWNLLDDMRNKFVSYKDSLEQIKEDLLAKIYERVEKKDIVKRENAIEFACWMHDTPLTEQRIKDLEALYEQFMNEKPS